MEESGKRNLPTAINRRISLIGHFLDQSIEIPMPQMTKMEVDNCVKTIDDLLEIHQNMAKLLNFQKIEMEDTLEKNKRLWYVLDNWETFMDPQMPLESDLDNRDALFSYEGPRNLQPMWKERLTLQLKINKNESIIKTLEEEKQKLIRLNPPSTI